MTTLTVAAAQSISIAGDVHADIVRHQRFIRTAAEQGVQVLVFPELSLSGYERGLAAQLAIARRQAAQWRGEVVPVQHA